MIQVAKITRMLGGALLLICLPAKVSDVSSSSHLHFRQRVFELFESSSYTLFLFRHHEAFSCEKKLCGFSTWCLTSSTGAAGIRAHHSLSLLLSFSLLFFLSGISLVKASTANNTIKCTKGTIATNVAATIRVSAVSSVA